MIVRDYVKSFVRARTGIAPNTLGDAVYDAAIESRCRATRLRLDAWVSRLDADEDEAQSLIDAVVIPETWFFRDERPFVELARHATTRSVDERAPLRVLSLPCSTGEEAYSIGIALREAGFDPGRFAIDAVDVSAESLLRARRGVYRPSSFRGTRADVIRERWCRSVPDGHELVDEARSSVRFRLGNVLDPVCFQADSSYAAIFCRNLLIYFDRPTRDTVVRSLVARLEPGGLFFVGHAESLVGIDVGLERLPDVGAFGYRKTVPDAGLAPCAPRTFEPARPRPKPRPVSVSEAVMRPSLGPAPTPQAQLAPPAQAASARERLAGLDLARKLADAGQLDRARDEVNAVMGREGPSAPAFHLLGIVAEGSGQLEDAERAFSRALYLDADHYESLVHMALLRERRGDASAERFRARAARVSRGGDE